MGSTKLGIPYVTDDENDPGLEAVSGGSSIQYSESHFWNSGIGLLLSTERLLFISGRPYDRT